MDEQCSIQPEMDAETEAANAKFWHKLCCLGELGWAWDGIYHYAPWKDETGERARFTDEDEAIKAEKRKRGR